MLTPPLPTVEEFQSTLLLTLRHEGDQGLWEAAWSLDCGAGQGDDVVTAKVSTARAATLGLLERGEIEIWLMDAWPPTSYTAFGRDAFLSLQDDDSLWVDPARAPYLFEVRLIGEQAP